MIYIYTYVLIWHSTDGVNKQNRLLHFPFNILIFLVGPVVMDTPSPSSANDGRKIKGKDAFYLIYGGI